MTVVLAVALDLLREALTRRWILALLVAVTGLLLLLGVSLRLDVVDGALAATSFFGKAVNHDIRAAEVALRPVFAAATYVAFYGGIAFGTLACSDFAPELLAPGRIEQLLALPVRRVQLLAGTFLGVMLLALGCTLYGALGWSVILGVKASLPTLRPVLGALLACVAFAPVYAVMLAASVVVRSAALAAAVGGLTTVLSLAASFREDLARFFEGAIGVGLLVVTAPLPRL
ncbi:MAG: ABC transporter permease subunit, partial [Deltaproteobacteria bacterium]|nr:ABC transporter permease subunit [Deltaproteobacteria bacterium]